MFAAIRNLLRQRRTLIVLGVIVLLWVLFLDSHSVFNRVRWYREADDLREENRRIEARISEVREELGRRSDDKEVERIAREAYGMRRDGETVYRVEDEGD
jgi:cell division protein FtsB